MDLPATCALRLVTKNMAAPATIGCLRQITKLQTTCSRFTSLSLTAPVSLYGTNRVRGLHSTPITCDVYPKKYVDPIVDRDSLPARKVDLGTRLFRPVKAMTSTDKFTCYHDPLVERFVNICMSHGNKAIAKTLVSKAFEKIKLIQLERYHRARTQQEKDDIICDPNQVFHMAVDNVRPIFNLLKYVKGGTIYMVPVAAPEKTADFIALRWIRESAKNKDKSVRIWDSLAKELLDASQNTGKSVRKKQDLHRQCEQNKAYAHFLSKR